LEIVVAATAEKKQVAAGFEAVLTVIVLGAGGALETSEILLLELVEEEGCTFSLIPLFISD